MLVNFYCPEWWVPGLSIGYEHSFVHAIAEFIEGLTSGKPASPTFREALETTKVCDAILKSGEDGALGERGLMIRNQLGTMIASLGK